MEQFAKVLDAPLVKDLKTGALISTDIAGLSAYKRAKTRAMMVDSVVDDINMLKKKMDNIEYLLQQLVENNK